MLQTIREYAGERLLAAGETDRLRKLHHDFFLALVEEAEPKMTGAEQALWLRRLETQHENLRAALEWSLAAKDVEGVLRFCAALQQFWWTRGYLSEGREWCRLALGKAQGDGLKNEYAMVQCAAGALAYYQGDYPAARAHYENSLAIWREREDQRGIATALNGLGNVDAEEGNLASARARREESLTIRRELGDRLGIASALNNLGNVVADMNDYPAARALHEEGLAISREMGDRWSVAISLNNLGDFACEEGDYPAARARYEESLTIRRDLGDRRGIASAMNGLGNVLAHEGDYAAARALFDESLTIRSELGDRRGIAYSLEALAMVAAVTNPLGAARIWGAAERLREEIRAPLPPWERPQHDRRVAAIRAAVDDTSVFDRDWADGRVMTLTQAMEFAAQETAGQRLPR